MRRLLVPPELLTEDAITLSGAPFHHLCRVLRTPVGAEVMVGDGRGLWLRCRLERAEKDCARLVVCERECHRDTALEVHLLQGLPKGDKLELVLQKATELGAARLTPVLTARSVPVRDALFLTFPRSRGLLGPHRGVLFLWPPPFCSHL